MARRLAIRPSTGVWKIAYADFVTAMMALFLLLWMVNTTSPDQKRGIAEYFAPPSISKSPSGYGGMFGGPSAVNTGPKAGDGMKRIVIDAQLRPALEDRRNPSPEANAREGRAAREARLFAAAQASVSRALAEIPDGEALSPFLVMVPDPDGLRLELRDPSGVPLFGAGSAQISFRLRKLIARFAAVLEFLPNRIVIAGHASAGEARPWALSSARAEAALELLAGAGVAGSRFQGITGKGSTEPVLTDAPDNPENRRISIILLTEAAPLPAGHRLQ